MHCLYHNNDIQNIFKTIKKEIRDIMLLETKGRSMKDR